MAQNGAHAGGNRRLLHRSGPHALDAHGQHDGARRRPLAGVARAANRAAAPDSGAHAGAGHEARLPGLCRLRAQRHAAPLPRPGADPYPLVGIREQPPLAARHALCRNRRGLCPRMGAGVRPGQILSGRLLQRAGRPLRQEGFRRACRDVAPLRADGLQLALRGESRRRVDDAGVDVRLPAHHLGPPQRRGAAERRSRRAVVHHRPCGRLQRLRLAFGEELGLLFGPLRQGVDIQHGAQLRR